MGLKQWDMGKISMKLFVMNTVAAAMENRGNAVGAGKLPVMYPSLSREPWKEWEEL